MTKNSAMCVSVPIEDKNQLITGACGEKPIHSLKRNIMPTKSKQWLKILGITAVVFMAGCSSMKTPATADVAVSDAAVENAAVAGGAKYAPVEMNIAREKMQRAHKAMAAKDYKLAADLANQAESDAKLAQGKANSGKAEVAEQALQDDIRVMREELNRVNK
jgi:hypothetical protein